MVDMLRLRHPGRPDLSQEHHATWLELFFDLVFVLALLRVTGRLGSNPSPSAAQLGASVGLYVVIQWAWVGQSFYDTRFDPDDTPHKLLVLAATIGAGAMALGVERVPADLLLPVGYLIVRGCLLAMYLRVLTADAPAREVVVVYLTWFGTGWLLWAASLAFAPGARPLVWIIALAVELLTPWAGRRPLSRHPVHSTHLPERLGQFTIILLGATLTHILAAVPEAHPAGKKLGAAAAAFLVPICIWWIYTTYITSRLAVPHLGNGATYTYVHNVAAASILFLGWALGVAIREVGQARPMPLTARLVLGTSMVTWILCGLGFQRVALRHRLPRQRLVVAVASIAPVVVVTLFVTRPALLLGLTTAIFIGYAAMVTPAIVRVARREERPAEGS
jgi:low temperature requirement protein LtrA